MNGADNVVPFEITEKMIAWRKWRSVWNWAHFGLGFLSAALSVIVATNVKQQFLPVEWAVAAAAVAAGLTFLVTALSASAKGAAFETAAREIEKSIALFRGGAAKASLYDAEARGIDILNKLK
jgi:hypothetical protein